MGTADHPANEPLIQCSQVNYTYLNGNQALENISFDVLPGERLGILGPNGGGKSTLINLILGELNPTSGSLTVLGRTPAQARSAGLIGAVPQHSNAIGRVPLSVEQMILFAASHRKSPWKPITKKTRQNVAHTLELVGLQDLASTQIDSLSDGQHQRLRFARALIQNPKIFILDEPMVGIDPVGQEQFAELLDSLHRQLTLSIVIVSHDIRAIAATCDRVLCIARTAHLHASPDGLTPTVLAEVFQHDVAQALGHSREGVHVDAHFASDCPGHPDEKSHGENPS
jgi:zinc transport system ATP-binding protein